MELRLTIEGAEPDDLKRGLVAAKQVFAAANIDPLTAADGYFALEGWDDAGFPETGEYALTDEDSKAADVWMKAEEAAISACCAAWPDYRERHGSLELLLSDDEKRELYSDMQEEEITLSPEAEAAFQEEIARRGREQ